MDFGTGVVKITPAHDPNDFEVGLRHELPIINVMTDDAKINELGGKYVGMDRYEARKAIVADLDKEGFLVKVEPLKHNVGACYRCNSVVEPRISKQWFVRMEPLAKPAIESVKTGDIKFIPSRLEKIYFNWMENIKDWCISRQLWWGHRIPAWYCPDCGEVIVSRTDPTKCPKCGCEHLAQDEDTLDTWFSSALWPFSTLGWPDENIELKYFYPTNTLVTGYDIIFFWVARMIFSGLEYTDAVPFKTVLFHGIVRDANGLKMSKSLGNGIDPLVEIEKYGADALRFTLATGNTPGNDMRYSPERVEASRNFANKIWNAARFLLMNLKSNEEMELPAELALEDKWILSKYNDLVKDVTENLDKYELGLAVAKLYDFIWDVFCDWYIELCKSRLGGEDEKAADTARAVLVYVFSGVLKLLHPFMPFITEEIWQSLPHSGPSIMVSKWPEYKEELNFGADAENFEKVISVIRAVRNRRSEMNVPPSKKAKICIASESKAIFEDGAAFIARLASGSEVEVAESFDMPDAVLVVTDSAKVYIPLNELVDFTAELARLGKELEAANKDKAFYEGKLNNPGFVAKAPEAVVNQQRDLLAKTLDRIALLEESIAKIKAQI